MIADPDADARRRRVRVTPHADRDRGALARVPDRVAHHVLDGAVQQLGIAEHDGVARLGNLDLPAAALRLERGILRHLAHDVREIDRLSGGRGGSALQPGQHQELRDQRVQALGFALDAVQDRLILTPLLARETERDVETRQRRAQLVRNVAQQPSLGRDQRIQPLGHAIEVPAELHELVRPAAHRGPHPHAEVSLRQRAGRRPQGRQRTHDVAGQPVAGRRRRQQHGEEPEPLRVQPIVKQPHQADRYRRHEDVAALAAHRHRPRLHRRVAVGLHLGLAARQRPRRHHRHRLRRHRPPRHVVAVRVEEDGVDPRGALELVEEAGQLPRPAAIENGHRLVRVAGQHALAEAAHAHLDRCRGGRDRELEGQGHENERRPEPEENLEKDARHHQSRPGAPWRVYR